MSPRVGRCLHATGMAFWGVQMVAVVVLMWPWDWRVYLLEISLAANFIGHAGGYSAERPTETVNEGAQP